MRVTYHLAFLGLLAIAIGGYCYQRIPSLAHLGGAKNPPSGVAAQLGEVVPLDSLNREGKHAHWYVPSGDVLSPMPLLLAFHGSGQPSDNMAQSLVSFAEREHFVIVAPQSGHAPGYTITWSVGDHPGDISEDWAHVSTVLAEVESKLGAKLSRDGWLALGFSGGASSAPYRATNDARFSAYAVLHGGVFEGGFGRYRPRGWFSTGSADTLRSPSHVAAQAENARRASGDASIVFRTFDGGHELGDAELQSVIDFWLER